MRERDQSTKVEAASSSSALSSQQEEAWVLAGHSECRRFGDIREDKQRSVQEVVKPKKLSTPYKSGDLSEAWAYILTKDTTVRSSNRVGDGE
jgi:hypothetical protein